MVYPWLIIRSPLIGGGTADVPRRKHLSYYSKNPFKYQYVKDKNINAK